jgi:conjugative coupling factor TraD (TOL family)
MHQPLEALLRPPVEWMTSITAWMIAVILVKNPSFFLLSTNLIELCSLSLVIFGAYRFYQGLRVYRYQRNLKRLPNYTMTSNRLPVSNQRQFLGKGFLWTATHTQRLRDLDLNYNLHFKLPSRLRKWARDKEYAWEKVHYLKQIASLLQKDHWANPFRPYPPIGGESCIHGVSEVESNISISLQDRVGHMAVIGTTRVGKTRFAEILIGQDIRRGDVVIVLDPKGDSDLLKRLFVEAKLAGREDDLLIFHLGFPELSCRYNPIGSFTKITQVATRVTNALPSTGDAASFKDFAWKYVNLVTKALVAMGVKPTYKLINFYITKLDHLFSRYSEHYFPAIDPQFEGWIRDYIKSNRKIDKESGIAKEPSRNQALLAYTKDYIDKLNQGTLSAIQNDLITDLFAACRLDKTYYDKITASVGPLLEKLTTGEVADLLSPDYDDFTDHRPVFDWLQVIRHKKIVYLGMDAMTDTVVSSAVGNAILTDLVSVAGHLYKFKLSHGFGPLIQEDEPFPTIRLHADEFNEVIGDEFIPILNKAGGSGFSVTVYTQTWSDVVARLGSESKAGQVAGNLNTIVMFRTKETATVDMLLKQLPMVPILRVVPASSSADTAHGEEGVYYRSTNEDRFTHSDQRLIEQNDVLNLPKGQAFCLLEGGKLYKLRMPLPKLNAMDMPPSLYQLTEKMRERQI